MNAIKTPAASVSFSPYAIVADMELPRTNSIYARVVAIQKRYQQLTGRWLEAIEAVRILDRLNAERDDVPMPCGYGPAADWLTRAGYDRDAVHQIVGHVMRHGTIRHCPDLQPEDAAAVEALLPRRAAR